MARTKLQEFEKKASPSERISDIVTDFVGSWKFIIVQTIVFFTWITVNIIGIIEKWDPYPFIFLNLMLALETVSITPLIMMSQNRQDAKDRIRDDADYEADIKTEEKIIMVQNEILEMQKDIRQIKEMLLEQKQK